MTELIICEKPSAEKKIADALADGRVHKKVENKVPYYVLTHNKKDIIVGSCVGHLYTIAQKGDKGWTYPVFDVEWQPTFEVSKNADYIQGYVKVLEKLAKKAKTFTIATDYDIEGEVIGWNALRFACKTKDAISMKC